MTALAIGLGCGITARMVVDFTRAYLKARRQ